MARRRGREDVAELATRVTESLRRFSERTTDSSLREKVALLADLLQATKDLGVGVVRDQGLDASGALERLRLYLVACCGVSVTGRELEVVAGISEYARRVRQLRIEQG